MLVLGEKRDCPRAGAALGHSWAALGPLSAALGPLLAALGPFSAALGLLLAALGQLLDRSWAALGRSWGALGRSWAPLESLLAALGTLLATLDEPSWRKLRSKIPSETILGKKHEIAKSIEKRKEKHTFLIPRWLRNAAEWSQDRPKSPLGRSWSLLGRS